MSLDTACFDRSLTHADSELRLRYLRISSRSPHANGDAELLEESATFLELFLFWCCMQEFFHHRGLEGVSLSADQLQRVVDEAFPEALHRSGIREEWFATNGVAYLRSRAPSSRSDREELLVLPIDGVARQALSVLEACPIGLLERIAEDVRRPEQAHRCRRAFDGIHAFTRRCDERQARHVQIAGRAYASGGLSLRDAAVLLDMSIPNTVQVMQELGFTRSTDVIRLTEDEREEAFRRIREERSRRAGKPHVSQSLVRREVIATQRIEGVDATDHLS